MVYKKRLNPFKPISRFSLVPHILLYLGILLAAGIIYLLFCPAAQISTVKVSGTFPIIPEEIGTLIKDQMGYRRLWLGRQRNILLFDSKEFESRLKNRYLVEAVSVKKFFPKKIEIAITEKPRTAIWISRGIPFTLDSQGHVLGPSPNSRDGLRIYDFLNILPPLDSQAIDPKIISFIHQLAKNKKLEPFGMRYAGIGKEGNQGLTIMTSKGFEILFDPSENLENQLDNLVRIIANAIPSEKIDKLEYIDLRFENRIFYRTK